jgi:putative ABC transport system permease protein
MKLRKCLKHAVNMVLHSRLRSWLTIIGIVIGVAAVIAIVSIGEGMQADINSRLTGLGGDILTLSAGFSRGGNVFQERGPGGGGSGGGGGGTATATTKQIVLAKSDVQVLRGIPDIALIETEIRGTVNVSYLGKTGSVSLTGLDQKVWSQITTLKIKDGRMLDPSDQNVIVIGGRLASSYFGKPVGINKMITIQNSAFRVVGILDDESNSIYMPIQIAFQIIPNKQNDVYDTITIKIKDEDQLTEAMAKIESRLITARHVTTTKKDFSLTSSKQMQATRAEMMTSVNAFLIAIAAVSLIVGAIGVANTMFTAVLEKTKEIGIMKAIGARNKDILMIFLLNSALIGLVGGILGVIAGAALSSLLPSLMGSLPMIRGSSLVSTNSVIMALSVSITVGIIAGIIPAYQASQLKPVDALRYE